MNEFADDFALSLKFDLITNKNEMIFIGRSFDQRHENRFLHGNFLQIDGDADFEIRQFPSEFEGNRIFVPFSGNRRPSFGVRFYETEHFENLFSRKDENRNFLAEEIGVSIDELIAFCNERKRRSSEFDDVSLFYLRSF